MANTYTWGKFINDVAPSENGLNNVIVQIHFIKYATNENGVSVYQNGAFACAAPAEASFIPYEDVTIEDRIRWTEEYLESCGVDIDARLDELMEDAVNPKVISNYPIPDQD